MQTVPLLLSFCPCYLDGKNLEVTKYWPAVFSKSPRTQELHCFTPSLTYNFMSLLLGVKISICEETGLLCLPEYGGFTQIGERKKSPVYN